MNVVDSTQIDYKNPSMEIRIKVKDMVQRYSEGLKYVVSRSHDIVVQRDKDIQAILEDCKREGISNEQIREMIETELKKIGLSPATIRRALPAELKQSSMIREHKPKQQEKKEKVLFVNESTGETFIGTKDELELLQRERPHPDTYSGTAPLPKEPEPILTPICTAKNENDKAILESIRSEGFDFNKPCEIWKDTCENIAEELTKIPNKQIVVFFQYAS